MSSPLIVDVSCVLGLLVALVVIITMIGPPLKAGKGIDGKWSVTNIQIILWTGVLLGSYFALSLSAGSFLSAVPTNTLVLIGITSGTLALSTTIRGVQENGSTSNTTTAAAG